MNLNRRSFIQWLTATFALPLAAKNAESPVPQMPMLTNIALPPESEIWLKEWLGAIRIPILDSRNNTERLFIRALRLNQQVRFYYWGGTNPGMARRLHPVMLYRVQGFDTAYVTGYCETRQEIRTFRLDRLNIVPNELPVTD